METSRQAMERWVQLGSDWCQSVECVASMGVRSINQTQVMVSNVLKEAILQTGDHSLCDIRIRVDMHRKPNCNCKIEGVVIAEF